MAATIAILSSLAGIINPLSLPAVVFLSTSRRYAQESSVLNREELQTVDPDLLLVHPTGNCAAFVILVSVAVIFGLMKTFALPRPTAPPRCNPLALPPARLNFLALDYSLLSVAPKSLAHAVL
jgi:hypothetical protein